MGMKKNDEIKENEMNRSITQVLYKYLPESWIDFYVKKTRSMYASRVRAWSTDILNNINSERLIEKIKRSINIFQKSGGKLQGFDSIDNISLDRFEIRTPKLGKTPDIFSEISPLAFYCSECNKVETKGKSSYIKKYQPNLSKCCKKELNQIALVYACECGWAGPVECIPCSKHGFEHMVYTNQYTFICSKCKEEKQMIKVCPECGKTLYPKPALEGSNFIPFSMSTVDLINMDEEKFLAENKDDGAVIIISNWIGKLEDKEYLKTIEKGIPQNEISDEKRKEIEDECNIFRANGIPEDLIKQIVGERLRKLENNKINIEEMKDYIDINIGNIENNYNCASNILEYYRILNADKHDGYISTLDMAKQITKELKTSNDYDEYENIIKNLGIKNIQACGNIPFISCSYGYTRKENKPTKDNNLKMRFFKGERDNFKNSIYGIKLMTEGILIELDKKSILNWMLKNEFISENDLPNDINNESKLKEWFLKYIDLDAIQPFQNIDKDSCKITSYVYTLLHSISHALIKQAGYLCGLDKDSLSEYIFPQIPAIFIYCQNSQGLSLGSLFNLYETQLSKWLKFTLDFVQNCIFDPICIEKEKACAGCIYINEISCTHFNKDLDRSYLIGNFDLKDNKRTFGFWEEAIVNDTLK